MGRRAVSQRSSWEAGSSLGGGFNSLADVGSSWGCCGAAPSAGAISAQAARSPTADSSLRPLFAPPHVVDASGGGEGSELEAFLHRQPPARGKILLCDRVRILLGCCGDKNKSSGKEGQGARSGCQPGRGAGGARATAAPTRKSEHRPSLPMVLEIGEVRIGENVRLGTTNMHSEAIDGCGARGGAFVEKTAGVGCCRILVDLWGRVHRGTQSVALKCQSPLGFSIREGGTNRPATWGVRSAVGGAQPLLLGWSWGPAGRVGAQ